MGNTIENERELPTIIGIPEDVDSMDAETFKAWCIENNVYYYGRPKESFSEHEAKELAVINNCSKLILDNLS